MTRTVTEIQASLEKSWAKRDDLQQKLNHALAIQALWDKAFKHGACSTRLEGNENDLSSMRFVIIDGQGNKQKFPLLMVLDKYPALVKSHLDKRPEASAGYGLNFLLERRARIKRQSKMHSKQKAAFMERRSHEVRQRPA